MGKAEKAGVRRQASGVKGHGDARGGVREFTIDYSESQLLQEVEAEAFQQFVDVRTAASNIGTQARAIGGALCRKNHLLDKPRLVGALRLLQLAAADLQDALGKLAFGLALAGLLLLPGCDFARDCDERPTPAQRREHARAIGVPGTEEHAAPACTTGTCAADGRYVPAKKPVLAR